MNNNQKVLLYSILAISVSIVIFVVVINIFTSFFIMPHFGSSMEPSTNCGVSVLDQEYETINEGDVIMYVPEYRYIPIHHRVVYKEHNYDPEESLYVITKENEFETNIFAEEFSDNLDRIELDKSTTKMSYTEAQQLSNQTIYITQGDHMPAQEGENVMYIEEPDPVLITDDIILGKSIYNKDLPKPVCDVTNPIADRVS